MRLNTSSWCKCNNTALQALVPSSKAVGSFLQYWAYTTRRHTRRRSIRLWGFFSSTRDTWPLVCPLFRRFLGDLLPVRTGGSPSSQYFEIALCMALWQVSRSSQRTTCQVHREVYREIHREINREMYREMYREPYREMYREPYREMYREQYRENASWTISWKCIVRHIVKMHREAYRQTYRGHDLPLFFLWSCASAHNLARLLCRPNQAFSTHP